MSEPTTADSATNALITMFKDYVCYDSMGRILSSCSVSEGTYAFMQDAGVMMVEGRADPHTSFVQDGVVTLKLANPAELDGLRLINLPTPCQIQIEGSIYDCDDGDADLMFSAPGTYSVRVIAWPYLDKEFTVVDPA